ncbi:MAG TPA: hypothetical protein VFD32_12610 [Dehalococcoidia bacterium]|nr:hypothetical protein [Dehalococcoidia bacterium]
MQQLPAQPGPPSATSALAGQIDDATLDAFLAEIDRHIDARLAQMQTAPPPAPRRHDAGNVAAIIGVGIPFVVLAGAFAHTPGAILAVLVTGFLGVAQMIREQFS